MAAVGQKAPHTCGNFGASRCPSRLTNRLSLLLSTIVCRPLGVDDRVSEWFRMSFRNIPRDRVSHPTPSMNSPTVIVSALVVTVSIFAVRQSVLLRQTESTIEDLRVERTRLETELGQMKQRSDAANQRMVQAELQSASLKDDLSQLFPKKETGAPTVAVGAKLQPGWSIGSVHRVGPGPLRSSPSAKALESTYHVLYRQLAFSPAQIEQFKAVMTEAATAFEDLEREAKQKRVSVMDRTIQPRFTAVDSELRAKLTSHFGSDALPVIERFTETLYLRDTVAHVATDLFYTNDPLTEPQANQLVEILAKNLRDPYGRLNPVFADADAMMADAGAVLSPVQLAVWRDLVDYMRKTAFAWLNPHGRRRLGSGMPSIDLNPSGVRPLQGVP